MANAPAVQTLDQVMTDLNPAYSASQNLITQQKSLIPQAAEASKTALNAQKVEGFNQINNQATGRGMSFSGIPLDEQANYLATKYLPGLQQIDAQSKADELALSKEAANLGLQQSNQAVGIRTNQMNDLNSWNMQQQSLDAQAAEAAKSRSFSASQAALDRAASAAPTPQQFMVDSFNDLIDLDPDWKSNGSTEKIISSMVNTYGMTMDEAAGLVYPWRKKMGGELEQEAKNALNTPGFGSVLKPQDIRL